MSAGATIGHTAIKVKDMNGTDLNIVAKQNNHEIYLISYKRNESIGFISDLEKGIRHADDKVQAIRKKGFWIDIHCSENVAKRILDKVLKLAPVKE